MYILKNAWTSIKRNKGRNILIGIIIIVIAAACAVTLSIVNSAGKIVNAYEEKYQIKASIGMNRNNLMDSFRGNNSTQEEMINSFNNIESLTVDEINNYGNSTYVESYYYTYSLGIDAKDLNEATDSLFKETTETKTTNFGNNMPNMPGGFSQSSTTTTKTEKIQNMKAQNGAFTLTGYNSYASMTEFIEGNYAITNGTVSSDFTSNTCVISSELATLNDIEVGDTITLIDTDNSKNTYKLEVTGIYEENTTSSNDMKNMFSSSANNIITNSNVVQTILDNNSDLTATITPTYILKDKKYIEKFSDEVTEKGLNEIYSVTSNLEEVESATKSITNVKTFAITFLVICLIIGGIVLLVINMINIRERKYEIGVLRTIGMSKIKVISQFMLELLIVAIVSLLIGATIGSLCSVKVANSLLASEISNSQNDMDNIGKNFGQDMKMPDSKEESNSTNNNEFNKNMKFNGVVSINEIDSINAVVDYKVLLELLGIGITLTLISSLSACIAIARFSPLSILKERS